MNHHTCSICDAAIPTGTRRRKYCSRKCEIVSAGRTQRAAGKKKVYPYDCAECGQQFHSDVSPARRERNPGMARCCSRTCSMRHTLRTGRRAQANKLERRAKAERKLQQAAEGTTGGKRLWVAGECWYCGEVGASTGRYCSPQCSDNASKQRRRAREYDVWMAPVSRWAVLKRHNFTCHICHEPIDMTLDINLAESASLDHVIPLLALGPHTEDNLRPAHMVCNSLKGIEEVGTPY